MARELNFKFKMPDDESLAKYISIKGEKGERGDPTKLSQLENDTGFVTASTDALTNYYTKAQTDSAIDADVEALETELGVPDGFFTDTSESISSTISSTITLDGTTNTILKGIKLYGDTQQNGTPTPESPVAVQTATGGQTIIISGATESQSYEINLGKNLFDKDNDVLSANCYLPASLTNTQLRSIASTPTGRTLLVHLQEGQTYTIQKKASGRFRFGFTTTSEPETNTEGVITSRLANADTSSSVTFTVPTGSPYFVCNFFSSDQTADAQNGYDTIVNSIQIEKGSTATSYADFIEPIELCSIGDYSDYIYKSGGKWYKHKTIGKVILDGSETWKAQTTSAGKYAYRLTSSDIAAASSNTSIADVYSNSFLPVSANELYGATNGYLVSQLTTAGYLRFFIGDSSDQLDAFKALLAANKPIVYYALAEVSEEEITNEALIGQLEALEKANSYAGSTAISVSGILPVRLSVEAFKNNWEGTISGISNELSLLEGSKADISLLDNYYTKTETDELVSDPTNPIYYGADPTGTTDSADAINACIQANKGKSINFTSGVYLVNSTINLPYANADKVSINGNGAVLKTTATLDNMIVAGYDRPASYTGNDVGFPSYIDKLVLDGSGGNVTNGILNMKGFKDLKIFDCTIFRFKNGVKIGDATSSSTDILISNCLLYGKGSEYDGVGVISNCSDNNVDMCRIYGFRKGFEINGYCNITKCHVLLRWAEQTGSNFNPYEPNSTVFNEFYEQTMFADASGTCRIVTCYCDSMYKFLEVNTTGMITVSSSFYYNARTVNEHLFEFNTRNPKITISECSFSLKKNDDCRVILPLASYFLNTAQINLANNLISGFENMTDPADIILASVSEDFHDQISITADAWYLVKVFPNFAPNTLASGSLYVNGYKYELRLSEGSIEQLNSSQSDSNWTIGVFAKNNTFYICIKRNSAAVGTKFDFFLENLFYQGWAVNPVLNADPATSSRLLSDYMEDVPTVTKVLKQANYS